MSLATGFICFFMALAFLGVLARIANSLKEINEKMIGYSSWYAN